MFVIGQDTATPGSNLHLWKVNDDLSFDASFGTIDLGTDFSSPTASNSVCVSNGSTGCSYVNGLAIYETADRFAFTFSRELNGSGNSSSTSTNITTFAIGKISTGEILGKIMTVDGYTSRDASDWAFLGAVDLAGSTCQSSTGSTYGGAPIYRAYLNTYNLMIRPDGSIVTSIDCSYTNRVDGQAYPSSLIEYNIQMYYNMPSFSVNTALTSNASTALYAPVIVTTYPRSNTVPDGLSRSGVTSYNGCSGVSQSQSFTSKIISIQADGTVKNSVEFPTGAEYFVNRWVIDPQGRWNATVRPMQYDSEPGSGPSAIEFIRLLPDGTFDASFGTNGIKAMPSLPSTVTINGASVAMNYNISGFATTATDILFTGFASASSSFTCDSSPYPDSTLTYYPYYVSSESGLLTTYGNDGLGEPVSIEIPGDDRCMPGGATRSTYINTNGEHVLFAQLLTIGTQSAGITSVTWPKADGVIGGGDGSGAVAATGRTDTKVYARKLPTRVQTNTTLTVLTKKASRTRILRSRTPKICVATREEIVMVKKGSCTVEILNKSTGAKIRTLTTRVRTTDATVGTTVTAEDAVMFKRASTRLSAAARAQIAEIAESASTAQRIILVGHTALLTEATGWNNFISLQRVARVKAALQEEFKKAGVSVPVTIVSLGSKAPLTTTQTEKAQSKNRRVNIYIVP